MFWCAQRAQRGLGRAYYPGDVTTAPQTAGTRRGTGLRAVVARLFRRWAALQQRTGVGRGGRARTLPQLAAVQGQLAQLRKLHAAPLEQVLILRPHASVIIHAHACRHHWQRCTRTGLCD